MTATSTCTRRPGPRSSPIPRHPDRVPLSPWPLLIGIALLVIGAVAFVVFRPHRLEPPAAPPASAPSAKAPAASAPAAERATVTTLPALAESDPAVRDIVGEASRHSLVAAWLGGEQLLRNAASVVGAVAEGRSPAALLKRLAPSSAFAVRTAGGRTVIDPASYARYAPVAAAVESIDPQAAARIYATVGPRLGEAYAELGTGGNLDDVVSKAVAQILAVPVVEGDVPVVPSGLVYAYADPGLEDLPPVQKLLLRMGPDNVRRIQARTREFAPGRGDPLGTRKAERGVRN